MPDENIEKLKKKTYLKMLENSVGSRLFNSVYVRFKNSGKETDVLQNGELSCAFFVSGLLTIIGGLDAPHSTVKTTSEKLIKQDWEEVENDKIQAGDVLVWEEIIFGDDTKNEHIGFALSKKRGSINELERA